MLGWIALIFILMLLLVAPRMMPWLRLAGDGPGSNVLRHPELVSGSIWSPARKPMDWMLKQVQHDGRNWPTSCDGGRCRPMRRPGSPRDAPISLGQAFEQAGLKVHVSTYVSTCVSTCVSTFYFPLF